MTEHATVGSAPSSSDGGDGLRPQKELLAAWTLLLLEAGEMHGYKLRHELLARRIELQPSSLYRWLHRFERDRWVVARWTEPVTGPRRHMYSLTPEGRAKLRDITGVVAAMRETYGEFAEAHADACARRGKTARHRDEAPPRARRDITTSTSRRSSAPSERARLRPHKELLVGWLLLHIDDGATYGWDLRREFEAHRLSPDPGAMYRTLRRLEADRSVQSRWMAPAAGPRRRFYRLTTRGRRKLDDIARLIAAILDAHDSYLQAYEQAGHGRGTATADDEPPTG